MLQLNTLVIINRYKKSVKQLQKIKKGKEIYIIQFMCQYIFFKGVLITATFFLSHEISDKLALPFPKLLKIFRIQAILMPNLDKIEWDRNLSGH